MLGISNIKCSELIFLDNVHILAFGSPVCFDLELNGEVVSFTTVFINTDEENAAPKFNLDILDDRGTQAQISFINFKRSLGTHSRKLLTIGSIGGKTLYMLGKITKPFDDSEIREIFLTFYLGGPSNAN